MKRLALIQIALLTGFLSWAQPNYEWAATMGGSMTMNWGNSVIADKSGNVYSTGFFMDQVDFDPDPKATAYLTSNGSFDIYISKLDKDGKFLWAVNIGGSEDDAGNSIKVDASGDVYVTGYFQSKLDFDPGSSSTVIASNGGMDIFVCKFDASGNFQWVSQMGGSGEDAGNGIILDASGDVYTTGFFTETVDFDPGSSGNADLTSYGGMDIFVSRLDGKGNYVWAGQMGGSDDDEGKSIVLDSLGYVFTTGSFKDYANFDPSPKSSGTYLSAVGDADAFVSKLDVKGNFSWAVPLGENDADAGTGITVDARGISYTTGYFYGTADFDPNPGKRAVHNLTSSGDADIFVWKLDAGGAFVWAKIMGGKGVDKGLSISIDADRNQNVTLTGTFEDAADFDPGTNYKALTSAGYTDAFISRLDLSGNYDWALQIGDADVEICRGIAVDRLNSVYITGGFMSTVDFDPGSGTENITSTGMLDAFILKLSMCKASLSEVKATACNTYTYNGNTYFKSGDYNTRLTNSIGCDSIVTLKLTLNSATFQSLAAGACDKYTLNGETYYAAGTYNQTLTNKAGCDSFLTLELKFLTSTGVLTTKSCDSYTANGQKYTTSGKYTQKLVNKAGCDSALTLNLTIFESTKSEPVITACNEYYVDGKPYNTTGIYTIKMMNNASCDSNITLDLTVNYSKAVVLNENACSSYKLNAFTYNKSGTYSQTIPTVKGCDSVITLNLSINNTAKTIVTTACQSYTLGAQTYKESGVYNQIIPNAKGCDSAITLNLTIKKVITGVIQNGPTLTSEANGAAYQWLDCDKQNEPIFGEIDQVFNPKVTGNYAVSVTQNGCTDNSSCYNVKVGNISNTLANSIQVFPNPTNGVTNVLLGNSLKNGTIKLLSITGQTIIVKPNLSGNSFKLNLSDEAKGVYFIEISQDGNVSRVKLVKN